MSVKREYDEDSEALSIAMEVMNKYSEVFEGFDLSKIRFLRVKDKRSEKGYKVTSVGFPFNIDIPYLYYIEIYNDNWMKMTEEQRNILVFSSMYEIAPNGMDPESSSYGKKRKKDIEDFSEVIAVAGGRYDWKSPQATGIHDILTNIVDLSEDDKNNIKDIMEEEI